MNESCPICTSHVYKITKTLTFENVYLSRETFFLSATHYKTLQQPAAHATNCAATNCNRRLLRMSTLLGRLPLSLHLPLSLSRLCSSRIVRKLLMTIEKKRIKSSLSLFLSVSLSVPLSLSLSLCFFHFSLSLSRFLFLALVFVPDALCAGSR